ncbi:hypothetical protein AB670_00031 [Chryseobacterium sp. MOF25P]|uniref:hypothetical protein n=1 Tax=unclassified Chryseobacterium TaxID=2593645 RepID=UPI000804F0C4|nr:MULTISPECIES: hypothetical protein [unclassified Chryseobacterium]OBW43502.1 hypothetical protein AB670_00031 [Chryseobacterium sp. MOF25P]OBW46724.1 hypothetical protein AB671_01220 [Chryseobacterium sp. BGARF1]
MNLDQYITLICENGLLDKTEFVKVQEQINEKNFMDMEDFDRLLHLGFPIDLELKKLKGTENISEILQLIKDKKVSARNFVAIIQSNVFSNGALIMHPLKSCNETE